jgi:hypothetical protein
MAHSYDPKRMVRGFAVLLAKGAPPGLVVYGFACFTNLAAALRPLRDDARADLLCGRLRDAQDLVEDRRHCQRREHRDLEHCGLRVVEVDRRLVEIASETRPPMSAFISSAMKWSPPDENRA